MRFKGFQKLSLLDFPGKVASIAFTGGCNLRCPFCHNVDLVLNPKRLPSITEGDIISYLKKRKKWIDGLVVTGGEPTIHEGLPKFLKKIKDLGFSTKLDTNGTNHKKLLALINAGLVDYVALDIKAPFDHDKYNLASGGNGGHLESVEECVDLLMNGVDVQYEFRTTFVPKIMNRDDVYRIAERIRGARKYCLQQFRGDGGVIDNNLSNEKPCPTSELERILDQVSGYFDECEVRG